MSCISLLEKRIIVALFFLSITLCVALFFYPPFTPIFSLFPPILRRLPVVFLSLFFFFFTKPFRPAIEVGGGWPQCSWADAKKHIRGKEERVLIH